MARGLGLELSRHIRKLRWHVKVPSIKCWNETESRNFLKIGDAAQEPHFLGINGATAQETNSLRINGAAAQEPNFLIQSSTEAVQPAINDGSCSFSTLNNLKPKSQFGELEVGLNSLEAYGTHKVLYKRLFEKVLSGNDVGWLNRVVIPKMYTCYLPCLSVSAELCGVELTFYDRSMTSWKFLYCHWKSSGSYAFTRGWDRFVREKQLRSHDKIILSKCQRIDARGVVHAFFMIDVDYCASRVLNEYTHNDMGKRVTGKEEVPNHGNERNGGAIRVVNMRPEKDVEADKNLEKTESTTAPGKGIKLFGVQIT